MSVTVDSQTLLSYFSADVALFVVTVFAFAVLHHVKSKSAFQKGFPKESLISVDQEYETEQSSIEEVVENQHSTNQADEPQTQEPQTAEPETDEKLEVSPEVLASMQKLAAAGNVKETLRAFRTAEQNDARLTSVMYNAVLQAWIKCGNVWEAEDWMAEIKAASMADADSFTMLIKAFVKVRDLKKAQSFLQDTCDMGISPSTAAFDDLLRAYAQEGMLSDGISLLEQMDTTGAQPTDSTLELIAELINGARTSDQSLIDARHILMKYGLANEGEPSSVPRLAAVLSKAEDATPSSYVHEVEATGNVSQLRSLQRTLRQKGFLGKSEADASPFDGHWHTEHGLTVIIDGKMVRWSKQRASRLSFTSADRRSCTLMIYGESSVGRLTQPVAPCAVRAIRWDNGDLWHAYDGRVIGDSTLFSQSMTKIQRNTSQDQMARSQASAVMACVSKHGLPMPSVLQESLMQYVGNDLFNFHVRFECNTHLSDIFEDISRMHPRVGFRHCWARGSEERKEERASNGSCGQRTLANGEETTELSFSQHIHAMRRV